MSRVDFYVLSENSSRENFVCDLTDKALQGGNKVIIHAPDQQLVEILDDLLWTRKDISFIPHARVGEDDISDIPVLIGNENDISGNYNVLVNLGGSVPESVGHYERVVEIVAGNESSRSLARSRFREYRERNFELHTHNIDRD